MSELEEIFHRPGGVNMHEKHGLIWLHRANEIGLDKLFMDNDDVRTATFSPNGPVYFDGKRVGSIQAKAAEDNYSILVIQFQLEVAREELPPNIYLYAVAQFKPKRIRCVTCGTSFWLGQEPCSCIFVAPSLKIEGVQVCSVTIYDGMKDDIFERDARASIVRKYFGGAVIALSLEKEIE